MEAPHAPPFFFAGMHNSHHVVLFEFHAEKLMRNHATHKSHGSTLT